MMLTGSAKELYEFDDFCVDASRHLLLRDGQSVNLAPRAFNMLLTLIRRRGYSFVADVKEVGESLPEAALPVAEAPLPVEPRRAGGFSSRQIALATLAVCRDWRLQSPSGFSSGRARPLPICP